MKSVLVLGISILALIGCAQAPLTVDQAIAKARIDRPLKVKVVGYFIHHHEGDGLYSQPGEQTGFEIALRFDSGFVAQGRTNLERPRRSIGPRYDQKFVMVSGTLKRGPFKGAIGMLADVIYLEVEDIKEANQSPQHNAGAGPADSKAAPPPRRTAPSEETARPQSPRG
jgi:hypothetical protein